MNNLNKRNSSQREQVRSIGLNGNYWYAAELSKNLSIGKSCEVIFWNSPIAIFRGVDGKVRALENRCAHRQLRLTSGIVDGNNIICQYHGWTYDECGKCIAISHEIGSKRKDRIPKIKIKTYPVQEKYGIIWVFPGDPEMASKVALPAIPQLDSGRPWKFVPIDITINAHFSMILENVCDFNHAFLHRKYRPFTDPHLIDHRREGDIITMDYETDLSQSQVVKVAGENQGKSFDKMTLWYHYPYQASNIADTYLHWLFMLPIDEKTTRCIFVFLFGSFEIPYIHLNIPRIFHKPLIKLINKFYVIPLLKEDLWALEEEMLGHERFPEKHHYEFNPIVNAFQKMSLEKWAEYLKSESDRLSRGKKSPGEDLSPGGGLRKQDILEFRDSTKTTEQEAQKKDDTSGIVKKIPESSEKIIL
jgi:phenylpropionate dioxygenase-like ring-hydroxylating dioxygenase large terminal subunit